MGLGVELSALTQPVVPEQTLAPLANMTKHKVTKCRTRVKVMTMEQINLTLLQHSTWW